MRKDFFERDYGHLADSDDATKVLGNAILEGVATLGDIRNAVKDYPADASIRPENDQSGFYVTTAKSKFFTVA